MRIASSTRDRSTFIGRIAERALLAQDLGRGAGLLTLTGPSGIGKTRLATQVGLETLATFNPQGGVWLCSLSGCLHAADVEAAVARLLGIPQRHGKELACAIGNRGRLLLILDNLDSVAAVAGEVIRGWLDSSDELQVLTTSIVPVDLVEAIRYEIGPLEAQDAVALYLERAHRASAGAIQKSDHPMVETLVGRLDRNPLAIELAAARVRVFPPHTLLSRFDDRFVLLQSGQSGRHGSLLEAVTLTWELLPRREQDFLAQASVFAGGLSYEAALAVLADGEDELAMIELLDGLRSKALVQLDATRQHRFILFESVREFAVKELAKAGLEADAYFRHAKFLLERGEEVTARCDDPKDTESLEWLRAERENLVSILLRNHGTPRHALTSARAGIVLSTLIEQDGYSPAGTHLLDLTLQAARDSGDERLIVKAIVGFCAAIIRYGRDDEAERLLTEGLEISRRLGDLADQARLLAVFGRIHLRRGQLEQCTEVLTRSIELARSEKLPILEAKALMDLGSCSLNRNAHSEGEAYIVNAHELLRLHHSPRREGRSLLALAVMRGSQGRLHEARIALESALAHFQDMGDRGFEASVLMNLGGVELAAGRLDEAERHSSAALPLQREIGNRRGEGIVLSNLGIIALERGKLLDAERNFLESLGIFQEQGERRHATILMLFLAAAEASLGRHVQARRSLDDARASLEEVSDRTSSTVAELIESVVDLAEASKMPGARGAAAQAISLAQARLDRIRAEVGEKVVGVSEALRLLEMALDGFDADAPAPGQACKTGMLLVGPEARWFQLDDKKKVDLRRRVSLRLILQILVEWRITSPGLPIGSHQLFQAGWPGVEIQPEQATQRLYVGIWTLRNLGLSAVLQYRDDGYLLHPDVPLTVLER